MQYNSTTFGSPYSQPVGVPEVVESSTRRQNETITAPFDPSAAVRISSSAWRLSRERSAESTFVWRSSSASRKSSLSMSSSPSRGATWRASVDFPLAGSPLTTTNRGTSATDRA